MKYLLLLITIALVVSCKEKALNKTVTRTDTVYIEKNHPYFDSLLVDFYNKRKHGSQVIITRGKNNRSIEWNEISRALLLQDTLYVPGGILITSGQNVSISGLNVIMLPPSNDTLVNK